MLSADESAELRELQTKAYGRNGALSVEELARLRDLEPTRSRNSPTAPIAEPAEAFDAGPAEPPIGSQVGRGSGDGLGAEAGEGSETGFDPSDPSDEPIAEQAEASPLAASRPRWALIVAASAALVLGVGIGWLVFGRDPGPAIPVTAEQQIRGEHLAEESKLDPGSIVPMAESSDVLVWMGTRDEGEVTCMIIEDGEHDATSCAPTDSVIDTALHGMLSRDAPSDSPENATQMISASLALVRGDDPIVMIQGGWVMSSGQGYLDHFTDPEQRATAERLLDQGLDEWSPMLAAYDADTQIWIGTRDQGQEACLFYGGEPDAPSACGSMETAQSTGVGMSMLNWDDDLPSGVSVTLHYTEQMMPSIVILHVPASEIPVDPETGDPIEFTFDDPTFDDLVTDGETGTTDDIGG